VARLVAIERRKRNSRDPESARDKVIGHVLEKKKLKAHYSLIFADECKSLETV
jgi:hypothetical protein